MKNFHLLTLSCYDSDSNSSYDTVYPIVTDDMPGFMATLTQRARTQWAQLKEVQQKRPAASGTAYTEWFNQYDALTKFEVIPQVAEISMYDLFEQGDSFSSWRITSESMESLYSRATPVGIAVDQGPTI